MIGEAKKLLRPDSAEEFFAKVEFMKRVKANFARKELEAAGIPYARINAWYQNRAFPAGKYLDVVMKLLKEKEDAKA